MKYLATLFFFFILLSPSTLGQEVTPSPTPAETATPALVSPSPSPESSPTAVPTPEETPQATPLVPNLDEGELAVAVVGAAPFVVKVGKDLEGVSIETWRALAKELEIDYELVQLFSMDEMLRGVQDGTYDVGVGPISITSERATFVAFTQPYYDSSLGILSLSKPVQDHTKVDANLPQLFLGFLVLILILGVVGAICWTLEHRANPEQFPTDPKSGIGSGMWMALVTMTTVGYGDKAPVTFAGRLFTGLWMIVTMVAVSSFTAWLATTLTVSKLEDSSISDATQLADKRVGVVSGTTSEVFVRHFTSLPSKYATREDALDALQDGKVDAVVYDYPVLAHHVKSNPEVPWSLAESTFALQDYGFVLSRDNPELHRYNVGLLRLSESGILRTIRHHWIHSASDAIPVSE